MSAVAIVASPGVGIPKCIVPKNACDSHAHIFGPFDEFPPSQPAVYAFPDASPERYDEVLHSLGMRYGVLTQPAPYGSDPSALLSAIAKYRGRLKGVAIFSAGTDARTIESARDAGIVGLRFSEFRAPDGKPYPGSVGFEALKSLAPVMRELGLHAQLWADAKTIADALPELTRLNLRLVLDHMGGAGSLEGAGAPEFAEILAAVKSNDIWVKLVISRVGKLSDYARAKPYHSALLDAAPKRCVWGSDWPYVRLEPPPDAAQMLDLFCAWTPDSAIRNQVLSSNPAELYGFEHWQEVEPSIRVRAS